MKRILILVSAVALMAGCQTHKNESTGGMGNQNGMNAGTNYYNPPPANQYQYQYNNPASPNYNGSPGSQLHLHDSTALRG